LKNKVRSPQHTKVVNGSLKFFTLLSLATEIKTFSQKLKMIFCKITSRVYKYGESLLKKSYTKAKNKTIARKSSK